MLVSFIATIIMAVAAFLMLRLLFQFTVALFSTPIMKAISLFSISYLVFALYEEFKKTGDVEIILFMIALIIVAVFLLRLKQKPAEKYTDSVPQMQKRSRANICPKCGCEFSYIPVNTVFTGRYEDRDGEGYWRPYTEDGMTKTEWVVPRLHEPIYEKVGGYWECPGCGKRK